MPKNLNKIMVIFMPVCTYVRGRERARQQLGFSCGYATASQLLHFKEVGQS